MRRSAADKSEDGTVAIVDNGVYVDGQRTANPENLDQTFELKRDHGGMAWIGLYRPDDAEIQRVADEFALHELAVEDALHGHQRSKLERYGETLFAVLRPARYLDAEEMVEFGELHVFVGPDFIVTIRQAESPDLAKVRRRLEARPELLALGPQAVLYAILDEVVDQYAPVVAGLENDIDEIEDELFSSAPDVARRIYDLSREVIGFQRATHPLRPSVLGAPLAEAPTLVGTVYGMNFEFMPELDWPLGYPFALALMLLMGVGLYLTFKRKKWL